MPWSHCLRGRVVRRRERHFLVAAPGCGIPFCCGSRQLPPCQTTPTCICCVGMEKRVGVGDELHLPIEVIQLGPRQGQSHSPFPFHLDPFHFRSHIKSAHRSCEVDLPKEGKERTPKVGTSFGTHSANWLPGRGPHSRSLHAVRLS